MEYIQDITAELRLLLGSGALPPQERLRVLLTAAEVVQSQASGQGHGRVWRRVLLVGSCALTTPLLS